MTNLVIKRDTIDYVTIYFLVRVSSSLDIRVYNIKLVKFEHNSLVEYKKLILKSSNLHLYLRKKVGKISDGGHQVLQETDEPPYGDSWFPSCRLRPTRCEISPWDPTAPAGMISPEEGGLVLSINQEVEIQTLQNRRRPRRGKSRS